MRAYLQAGVAAGWGNSEINNLIISDNFKSFRLDNFEMAIADAEKALQCPCSSNLSYIAKAQAFYCRYVLNHMYMNNSGK